MYKNRHLQELDIPKTDLECWEKYPKHRWVYDLTRILDIQNIKWDIFPNEDLCHCEPVFNIDTDKKYNTGYIYTENLKDYDLISEVYISKGEIKLIRHLDSLTDNKQHGEIDLKLNAFVSMHFQKFSGVITVNSYHNKIVRVSLKPHDTISIESNQEIVRLLKKIYKKIEIVTNGLTDRSLRETIAS